MIQKIETGVTTSFRRSGGIYALDPCLEKGVDATQSFTGQGGS